MSVEITNHGPQKKKVPRHGQYSIHESRLGFFCIPESRARFLPNPGSRKPLPDPVLSDHDDNVNETFMTDLLRSLLK